MTIVKAPSVKICVEYPRKRSTASLVPSIPIPAKQQGVIADAAEFRSVGGLSTRFPVRDGCKAARTRHLWGATGLENTRGQSRGASGTTRKIIITGTGSYAAPVSLRMREWSCGWPRAG